MSQTNFSGPVNSEQGFMVNGTTVIDSSGNLTVTAGSVGTAELADNGVTNAKIATNLIQTATVTVTNAQIKALRATPKTLVAAQGAGTVLEFLSAVIKNNGGTNAITESDDNLAIRYTDGSGAIVSQAVEGTGFIDQTAATVTNALPKIDAIVAYANAANKALVLHNTGDGEYAGNAAADVTLTIDVQYRVHTI